MMHAELTDRANSKTKDGGVEMENWERHEGKASKCTANGESLKTVLETWVKALYVATEPAESRRPYRFNTD